MAANVDSCNTFAQCFYGRPLSGEPEDKFLEQLRQQLEKCDVAPNFSLYHSYGGGTGSRFTAIMAGYLDTFCPESEIYTIGVVPNLETNILRTYNAVLATHHLHRRGTHFLFENRAIKNVQKDQEQVGNHFRNINRRISCSVAAMATSMKTNSFPNLHARDLILQYGGVNHARYPLITYAEVQSNENPWTIPELTQAAFKQNAQMLSCDPQMGRVGSLRTLYSGLMRYDAVYDHVMRLSQRYLGIDENPKIKVF